MVPRDDFWLQIHDLSLLLDCGESDLPTRLDKLAADFTEYPPVARRQLGHEFHLVAAAFQKLAKRIG